MLTGGSQKWPVFCIKYKLLLPFPLGMIERILKVKECLTVTMLFCQILVPLVDNFKAIVPHERVECEEV